MMAALHVIAQVYSSTALQQFYIAPPLGEVGFDGPMDPPMDGRMGDLSTLEA